MKTRTNSLILATLHIALTVQVYWSNERNEPDEADELNEVFELDEVDEVNELDEVDEVKSAQTVPEWSTSFSKREVLHFWNLKYFIHSLEWSSSRMNVTSLSPID